jgi:hypothetical protein
MLHLQKADILFFLDLRGRWRSRTAGIVCPAAATEKQCRYDGTLRKQKRMSAYRH